MQTSFQPSLKGTTVPVSSSDCRNYLEPPPLAEAFLNHPPDGFEPLRLGAKAMSVPGFLTRFDILTTLDDDERKIAGGLSVLPFVDRILKQRTVFVGTTVTEYAILPAGCSGTGLAGDILDALRQSNAQLAIVKDLPDDSPLLSEAENRAAAHVADGLAQSGFQLMSGQALAYVPIDFASIDEYMGRLSATRRKEFRRKLRARDELSIEVLQAGAPELLSEAFLAELFQLYLNVYEQSQYHFDRLTADFFRVVLADRDTGGVLFVYRHKGKMIGWNLCFSHGGNLVDKYVGFAYPEARDLNLYFVSWFYNLEWALAHGQRNYIAGWTDPDVKAALGARFTFTRHAVYVRNPLLRFVLRKCQRFFEPDKNWAQRDSQR